MFKDAKGTNAIDNSPFTPLNGELPPDEPLADIEK